MHTQDLTVRPASTQADVVKLKEIGASNQKRLKEIVNWFGWPTLSMVGENGAEAARFIALHSDSDKDFQQEVLRLMAPLVEQGETRGHNYASLYDYTHYPQRFGTHGGCVIGASGGEWQPFEIEDIAKLGQRRRQLGLPSLADHAQLYKQICAHPTADMLSASDSMRTVPVPPDEVLVTDQ